MRPLVPGLLLLVLLPACSSEPSTAPSPQPPATVPASSAPAVGAACAELGSVRAELAALQGRLAAVTRPSAPPEAAAEVGPLQGRLQQLRAQEARAAAECGG